MMVKTMYRCQGHHLRYPWKKRTRCCPGPGRWAMIEERPRRLSWKRSSTADPPLKRPRQRRWRSRLRPRPWAYGNGRGALAEFDKDIDRRFAEYACRQQKLLDDFHVEVEVFTRAQEKLESGLVKVNEDLTRITSINDKRYAQRSAADQERDSKLEAAAASARRAAEAVARLANVPSEAPVLKFAEAPAAAPTDSTQSRTHQVHRESHDRKSLK